MKTGLIRLLAIGAILLMVFVAAPVVMRQFHLWRYRAAIESLDKFCLGVQRQDRNLLNRTPVILNGKHSPLINHREIYFTIGQRRLNLDFVKSESQKVILLGEFEHMFSSSEQLRQKLFFLLEHDKTAWRVTAISDQTHQLDVKASEPARDPLLKN